MRSLFLKVFLWFWLAMVLLIGVLAATSYVMRTQQQPPRPPAFIEGIMWAYSRSAVANFEREGGAAALNSYLGHVERDASIRAHLFDAAGSELAGRDATPDEKEIAAQVVSTGNPLTKKIAGTIYEAYPMPARDGGRYAFVAAFPFGDSAPRPGAFKPPHPPGLFSFFLRDTQAALALRALAVLLTASLLCYLLARYIVSPVLKLRAVTGQVARGDFSARVSPLLGKRRDELADLGHDFDAMAARIEILVNAQHRLIGDISHELRSPLTRLGVALELARQRTAPEASSMLDRIGHEAENINEMIGQLLTLSRIESSADDLKKTRLDLAAVVREIADDADFEARSRDRSARATMTCEPCTTMGVPGLIGSAVENVVRNAVRHTAAGTAVEIELSCAGIGFERQAVITVRDRGAGVPEDALDEIFRPFYRVEEARDRQSGGTGLGLAIAARALHLHGGHIKATNASDGGLIVEMTLPLKEPTK